MLLKYRCVTLVHNARANSQKYRKPRSRLVPWMICVVIVALRYQSTRTEVVEAVIL